MNFKHYFYIVLFFSLTTISCKKNIIENPNPGFEDLKVPVGFDWETSRNVTFKVGVSDTRFEDAIHLVSIYKGDPNTGGILLSTGGAAVNKPFESKIYLADTVNTVYIVKRAPDNSTTTEEVEVAASSVDLSIGQVSKSLGLAGRLASVKKMATTVSTSPNCTTGCSTFIELTSWSWLSYVEVKNGQTVCVSGTGKSFNVRFGSGGGTLRICGENNALLTMENNSNTAAIKIIVTESGSVTFHPDLNLNPAKDVFENYGTSIIKKSFGSPRTLINNGTLSLGGDYIVKAGNNSANTHANTGTITVPGTMKVEPTNTFTNTGTMTLSGELQVDKATFNNQNNLSVAGNFIIYNNSTFTNSGKLTATKELQLSSGNFNNEKDLSVSGKITIGGNSIFTNTGKVIAENDLMVNSEGRFINRCNLWVKRNLDIDNSVENYGLIKVDNDTKIQGNNNEFAMYEGAMLKTGNLYLDRTIKGYGSTSLVKVLSKTDINGSGLITGNIQFCDGNGIEKNNGRFTGNAALGCNLYIPVSECNTEGNGEASKDADSDGVTDALDAYPTDKARAFNNYYPSGGADAGATLVFEDNWPRKGDYDMNDLAISYKYQIVTNADNEVVDVIGDFSLYATGGSFNNGFGVEFPVSRSSVSALVGGPTLEEGQSKAVVVLFDDMRGQMTEWNTIPNTSVSPSKNYTFKLTLKEGPKLDLFGLGVYNPFIWNSNSKTSRGIEIHLPGNTPTDLANTSLFGTNHDYSNVAEGRYYVTSEGLPWGLNIPVNAFEYPIEKTAIADAYLKFNAWVQSGGNSFLDWYINKGTEYRTESKIFSKK